MNFHILSIIGIRVSVHTKCIKVSLFIGVDLLQINIWSFGMFFFHISIKRVFMSEDEVQFVVFSTFIRPKHDAVRCTVMKLLLWVKRCIHHPKMWHHLFSLPWQFDIILLFKSSILLFQSIFFVIYVVYINLFQSYKAVVNEHTRSKSFESDKSLM